VLDQAIRPDVREFPYATHLAFAKGLHQVSAVLNEILAQQLQKNAQQLQKNLFFGVEVFVQVGPGKLRLFRNQGKADVFKRAFLIKPRRRRNDLGYPSLVGGCSPFSREFCETGFRGPDTGSQSAPGER